MVPPNEASLSFLVYGIEEVFALQSLLICRQYSTFESVPGTSEVEEEREKKINHIYKIFKHLESSSLGCSSLMWI